MPALTIAFYELKISSLSVAVAISSSVSVYVLPNHSVRVGVGVDKCATVDGESFSYYHAAPPVISG